MAKFPWPLTFELAAGKWLPTAEFRIGRQPIAVVEHVQASKRYSVHLAHNGWKEVGRYDNLLSVYALLTELEKVYAP